MEQLQADRGVKREHREAQPEPQGEGDRALGVADSSGEGRKGDGELEALTSGMEQVLPPVSSDLVIGPPCGGIIELERHEERARREQGL